jgi:hypothetical protein
MDPMKDRLILTALWYLLCLSFKLYRSQATTPRQIKLAEAWGFRIGQWRREAEAVLAGPASNPQDAPTLSDYHAEAD